MLNKRFPMVLMLEPLHACNLTCTGCGRIREYESTISQMLTLEQCLAASDECGAPTVSICGGEPFLHPKIGEMSMKLIERGRNVILCTNGMFIKKKIGDFRPNDTFFLNVHLDGMEKTHDLCVEREGVFQAAIEGIQIAKQNGFKVMTNTTVYRKPTWTRSGRCSSISSSSEVDGHTISPAYGYSAVNDRDIFMTRDDIQREIQGYRQDVAPLPDYQFAACTTDFLKGDRELPCTVWGSPTYNVLGLERPMLSHHGRAL